MPYFPKYRLHYDYQARIAIDVGARTLTLYVRGALHRTYPCAVGKPSTPTPTGNWQIQVKIVNPDWEVLGTRWMGLNVPWGNYGIHGTNAPWSIGHQISNGCIRMYNEDVEEVFDLVPIGTPVDISGSYAEAWGAPAQEELLAFGSSGPRVAEIQARLIALGYLDGTPDGVFGPRTHRALVKFQEDNNLTPDGIVGPSTRAALGISW